MTENDLAKTLAAGGSGINAAALAERVLRRDRRRIMMLSILCIAAWMAVVMLPWGAILPMLAKIVRFQEDSIRHTPPGTAAASQTPPMDLIQMVRRGTIATFFGSVASMFVAAVSTVSLIVMSRRATLRQVNARLAEIAAELRAAR